MFTENSQKISFYPEHNNKSIFMYFNDPKSKNFLTKYIIPEINKVNYIHSYSVIFYLIIVNVFYDTDIVEAFQNSRNT